MNYVYLQFIFQIASPHPRATVEEKVPSEARPHNHRYVAMTLPLFLLQLILIGSIGGALSAIIRPDDLTSDGDSSSSSNSRAADLAAISSLSAYNSEPDFHQQHNDDSSPQFHWNADYLWSSPQIEGDSLVDDQPATGVKRAANSFIRLGRNNRNAFMRLGRGEKGFIRFGRSGGGNVGSNGNNIGRRDNGFLRFGRDSMEHFISTGGGLGDLYDDSMRFGRRGDKFIRFGRSQGKAGAAGGGGAPATGHNSLYQNDFDRENSKRYEAAIGGKVSRAAQNFIRLGRARTDNNFIRLGKKSVDNNSIQWGNGPWLTSTDLLKNAQLDLDDITPTSLDTSSSDSFNHKHDEPQRIADNDFPIEK